MQPKLKLETDVFSLIGFKMMCRLTLWEMSDGLTDVSQWGEPGSILSTRSPCIHVDPDSSHMSH